MKLGCFFVAFVGRFVVGGGAGHWIVGRLVESCVVGHIAVGCWVGLLVGGLDGGAEKVCTVDVVGLRVECFIVGHLVGELDGFFVLIMVSALLGFLVGGIITHFPPSGAELWPAW